MNDDVTISGLTIRNRPSQKNTGETLLAFFDCEARGIVMVGCALLSIEGRSLKMVPPSIKDQRGLRCIHITDKLLRGAIVQAAYAAYIALGGKLQTSTPEGSGNA